MKPYRKHARSVLTVAARAGASFLRHQGHNHAAAAAFYSLLSVIPVFFLAVLLLGEMLGDRGQALAVAGKQLTGLVPWFDDELMGRIRRLTWAAPRLGPVAMILISWSAGIFFAMLRRNLLLPWRDPDAPKTPDWRASLRFWLGAPLVCACLIGALAVVLFLGELPAMALTRAELRRLDWLLPVWDFARPWAYVACVYLMLLPGVRPLRLTLAVSGVLALAGWGLTALFSAALSHLPRHALVYGPLADAVLFLLWLNYNAALLVYGGHFIRIWRREHPRPPRDRRFALRFRRGREDQGSALDPPGAEPAPGPRL